MNNSYIYSARRYFLFSKVACFVAVVAISQLNAHAQCPAGNDPDSLGCAVALEYSSQLSGSPASVSMQEAADTQSPKLDNLTAPSSNANASILPNRTENHTDERNSLRRTIIARPEPLTEFQQFVAASIGQTLPIYGADLFSSMPAS